MRQPGEDLQYILVPDREFCSLKITLWGDRNYPARPDFGLVDCGVDGSPTAEAVESEAREIERRYRTLVEQLPLVVYVDALDEGSSNIFTSGQIEPLLGYTVEELSLIHISEPTRPY